MVNWSPKLNIQKKICFVSPIFATSCPLWKWFNMNNCFFTVAVPAVAGDTQKSSSHFHCLKCDYYCTDTNKVVAHRRQHQKLDSIMAAGFEKYTPTQFCPVGGCPHNGKQTHYHCSKCQYAVLGLSQMEGHKYRHMNEWSKNKPPTHHLRRPPKFLW